jgi:uncharacterized protein YodC (DUF2158 family)
MPIEIRKGDTVQLKSGGPKMTVNDVGDDNGVLSAWCVWFIKDQHTYGVFPVTSLKVVE